MKTRTGEMEKCFFAPHSALFPSRSGKTFLTCPSVGGRRMTRLQCADGGAVSRSRHEGEPVQSEVVGIEKLFLAKSAKMKLRQDAI
jgi:hypothetical protein